MVLAPLLALLTTQGIQVTGYLVNFHLKDSDPSKLSENIQKTIQILQAFGWVSNFQMSPLQSSHDVLKDQKTSFSQVVHEGSGPYGHLIQSCFLHSVSLKAYSTHPSVQNCLDLSDSQSLSLEKKLFVLLTGSHKHPASILFYMPTITR